MLGADTKLPPRLIVIAIVLSLSIERLSSCLLLFPSRQEGP